MVLTASACASRIETEVGGHNFVGRYNASYEVCSGYGCPVKQQVELTRSEWRGVRNTMLPLAETPQDEREHIRLAVARLEQLSGPLTGTDGDIGETFGANASRAQMDCLDEAINTANYLQMLDKAGLLLFHTPAGRARRGYLIDAWPHTSAIMREDATGQLWVVDSWFLNNGNLPFILPVEEWSNRWHPPKTTPTAY